MNFTGKWLTKNGETYAPGTQHAKKRQFTKYYEKQWNRAPEFDLMERISEKDSRK